ncbi:hypothetical protein J7426_06830 [Tropicibacter sp. R16_0]|uniref:hypothetical protein n=1 Tax=Tropicibacter sp. R16_0 TaxID=2821102 RepID=UPI001ADA1916|nr:hypothetical protein [Tropicibacter sp. R16_0]MBO9449961.1 hypothetical protein [Tropicibacter sp. R16_0]
MKKEIIEKIGKEKLVTDADFLISHFGSSATRLAYIGSAISGQKKFFLHHSKISQKWFNICQVVIAFLGGATVILIHNEKQNLALYVSVTISILTTTAAIFSLRESHLRQRKAFIELARLESEIKYALLSKIDRDDATKDIDEKTIQSWYDRLSEALDTNEESRSVSNIIDPTKA